MGSWRDIARPIIAKALAEAVDNGMTEKETKRFIHLRYPFGPRSMYPYKIWCNEIRIQLGLINNKTVVIDSQKPRLPLAGQKELFS